MGESQRCPGCLPEQALPLAFLGSQSCSLTPLPRISDTCHISPPITIPLRILPEVCQTSFAMSSMLTIKQIQRSIFDLLGGINSDVSLIILRRVKYQVVRERRRERHRQQYGLSMQEVGLLLDVNRNSMPRILTQFGIVPVRGPRRGLYVTEAQFIELRTARKSHVKEKRRKRRCWMQPRVEVIAMLRREFNHALERADDSHNHSQRLRAFNEVKYRAPKRLQQLIVYVRGMPSIFNPDTMQRRGDLAVVLSRAARIERLLQCSRCDRSLFYSASSKTASLDDPLGGSELTLMQVTPVQSVSPLDALIEQEKITRIAQRLADARGISLVLARELVNKCLEDY